MVFYRLTVAACPAVGVFGQLCQKCGNGIVLLCGIVDTVDFSPNGFSSGKGIEIPADVFARNPCACEVAVKAVYAAEMLQNGCAAFA